MFRKLLNIFNIISSKDEPRIRNIGSPFGGEWTHLLVKRIGNTVYVYMNNVEVGSKILTSKHLELDSNNRIGASIFNANSILQGELKKFYFISYAVDDTERTNIYNDQ